MKKVCVMALVLGVALAGQATELAWSIGQPGTWVDGTPQNGTGWYVAMYDVGGAGLVPTTLGGGPVHTEVGGAYISGYIGEPGQERLAFNTPEPGPDVSDAAFVYTVIWNSANPAAGGYNTDDWYLILDNRDGNLFDVPEVPEPPAPVDYIAHASGAAGTYYGFNGQDDWQQVPEPSAVALFALGLGVVGMVVRRRLART